MRNSGFCTNCGSYTHNYKYCHEGKVSCGIILLKMPEDVNITKMEDLEGIKCETENDILKWNEINNIIFFLLVRQKYSYGYCDFIRGKYNLSNVDNIVMLFNQMTTLEKEELKKKPFDELWDTFWGGEKIRKQFEVEYEKAKVKFETLKNNKEIGMDFYISNCSNGYLEWGFPKGRRTGHESDLECAMREFEEETGISKENYKLINIEPICEKYIGTNGVKYIYRYFVGIAKDNLKLSESKSNEIGNINFFKYNDVMEIITKNFPERKNIIYKIYVNIVNLLMEETKK